ncbi:glycosyltransferase [Rahnella sp. PD12R]|uniref:glycosyltransferase family 2 protein n=1 Tax=Rahnella sp. PD12R TaxID=2855688 RepID=UPI001C437106|nr:glycosyltransferase family 2 protein [Rahnella sp. PD12R]MBV6821018.1 glycosyltransferase [Rahnella sp. PD12R]
MGTHPAIVSVLIPVFNSGKYINKALLSVTSQTYSDIEIIIVDDCSTDSSWSLVNDFFVQHPNFCHKIIKNDKNEGVSFTRNRLVGNASGEFICFLDSDDYFEPDAIEYLMGIIAKNKTSIGQCLYYSEELSGERSGNTNNFYTNNILQGKDAVFSMLDNEITGFLWHKIFKRELFKTVRFNADLSVFEDYLVIMTLFIQGASISFGNEAKYHYVQHPASLTKQSYQKALNRLTYLEITKYLVAPLVTSEADKLRLIRHEYIVILMVFINAIKSGAAAKDVVNLRAHIVIKYLFRLKNQLSVKRFCSILAIRISPSLLYYFLKSAFLIKP